MRRCRRGRLAPSSRPEQGLVLSAIRGFTSPFELRLSTTTSWVRPHASASPHPRRLTYGRHVQRPRRSTRHLRGTKGSFEGREPGRCPSGEHLQKRTAHPPHGLRLASGDVLCLRRADGRDPDVQVQMPQLRRHPRLRRRRRPTPVNCWAPAPDPSSCLRAPRTLRRR